MQANKPLNPHFRRWMLTLLVPYQGWKELEMLDDPEQLLLELGCGQAVDDYELDLSTARAALQKAWRQTTGKKPGTGALPARLASNIQRLQELVGLSATECRILEFAVCLRAEPRLYELASRVNQIQGNALPGLLSNVLAIPQREIASVINANSALFRSGLLDACSVLHGHYGDCLTDRLAFGSESFVDVLFAGEASAEEMLRDSLRPAPRPHLKLSDYLPQKEQLDVLLPYLRHCMEHSQKAVNILLYGPPGTGKTQLAQLLGKTCKVALYEVLTEDRYGDQLRASHRLSAYRMAQCFLTSRNVMLMFDETEEIFTSDVRFGNNKSWINQILESNSVPAIWIANDIGGLDAAFIRRFDMVLELPYPEKEQRIKLLKRYSQGLLDKPTIQQLAEQEQLSPAIIARAAKVVGTVAERVPNSAAAMQLLMHSTLTAQGFKIAAETEPENTLRPYDAAQDYDPQFIRADADLAAMVPLLKETPEARICLYGPPGTGKTAYGHWLAKQLDMPLKVYRASDLKAPYVGESEQNIAKAFKEAQEAESILLIDEVDSFLRDRRSARQSWESSMVNEMLTQMESYTGIFIASTNLMDGLDQAVLRRFDIKTKFDFLDAEQVWSLFDLHRKRLRLKPDNGLKVDVQEIAWLTPGDFAAVARQVRFKPVKTARELLERLDVEMQHKEQAKQRRIGF